MISAKKEARNCRDIPAETNLFGVIAAGTHVKLLPKTKNAVPIKFDASEIRALKIPMLTIKFKKKLK